MSDTSALLGAVCPNWFCRSSGSPRRPRLPENVDFQWRKNVDGLSMGTQLRDSPGFAPEFPFNAVGAARHGNKTGRKGKKKLCNIGKNRLSLQLLKLSGVSRKKY